MPFLELASDIICLATRRRLTKYGHCTLGGGLTIFRKMIDRNAKVKVDEWKSNICIK